MIESTLRNPHPALPGPEPGEQGPWVIPFRLFVIQTPTVVLGVAVNVALVLLLFRNAVPALELWGWGATHALFCVVRLVLWRILSIRWARGEGKPERLKTLVGVLLVLVPLSGSLWGAMGYFLLPLVGDAQRVFFLFVAGGLAVSSLVAYASMRWVAVSFYLPVLLPMALSFFQMTETQGNAGAFSSEMGGLVLLFAVLLLPLSWNINRTAKSSTRLSEERAGLLASLQRAKAELDVSNENLRATLSVQEELGRRLAESEARFRGLVENAVDAILLVVEGMVVYANPAFFGMTGYRRDEILDLPLKGILPESPLGRELVMEHHRARQMGREAPSLYEAQVLRGDGGVLDVQVSEARAILDGKAGVISMLRDITGEKVRALALAQATACLEMIRDAVFMFDPDTLAFTYANQGAQDQVGYTIAELDAMTLLNLIPDFDEGGVLDLLQPLRDGDVPSVTLETRHHCKDGTMVPVEVVIQYIDLGWEDFRFVAVARDISERRALLEAKRQADERLALHLEQAPLAAIELDLDGRVVNWNRAAEHMFGYSHEQVHGRNVLELLVPEEELEGVVQVWSDLKRDRGGYFSHNTNRTRDGRRIICKWYNTPLRDRSGQVIGVASLVQDVTENVQHERERLRLEMAVNQSAESILITSPDGVIQYVNPAFENITGYAKEEVLGRTPRLLKSGRVESAMIQGLWEHLLAGESWSGRFINRRKDGSLYEDHATISPVKDQAGRIINFISVQRDLTEQRKAERDLMRLAQAVEQATEGICITGQDWRVVYVNSALVKMAHSTASDLMDAKLPLVVGAADGNGLQEAVEKALKTKHFWRGRISQKSSEGSALELEMTISPILEGTGLAQHHIVVVRDITKERQMEVQLRQSTKMQAIGTLAGGIAHDFNNILTPILGYTEMLQEKLAGEPTLQGYVEVIEKGARRARDLVGQILLFSRKTESRLCPVELGPIVKEVVKLLMATLPRTIRIVSEIEKDVIKVNGDPALIHTVVMNLCVNGGQAMPEGGELRVGLRRVWLDGHLVSDSKSVSGDYVELTVADSGVGMDPETQSRIFEPFFTTKGLGKGTGLGLSIVYGIIQQHHGYLEVRSTPGQGTTVRVFLPYVEQPVSPRIDEPVDVRGGLERVLFVDDEHDICLMGAAILKKRGFDVIPQTDPIQALEEIRADPDRYDLLLTDMNMPRMTGEMLAQAVREIRPELPVVIVSGALQPSQQLRLMEQGIAGVVSKPFSGLELARIIRKALDDAGSAEDHSGTGGQVAVAGALGTSVPGSHGGLKVCGASREDDPLPRFRFTETLEAESAVLEISGDHCLSEGELRELLSQYARHARQERSTVIKAPPVVIKQLVEVGVDQFATLQEG